MSLPTGNGINQEPGGARSGRAADLALAAVVVLGLCCAALLLRRAEAAQGPGRGHEAVEESFYFEPQTLKRVSLAFDGLAADWYWMRTLQYVGRKVVAYDRPLPLDDLSALNLDKLYRLLDSTTTLDPQFYAAYEYGAVVLPAVDRAAAVRLLEKGVRENPRDWRLFHHLGYIHWQSGRYAEAAAAYREGALRPGAPTWVEAMAANMEARGGSRQTAREIYRRIYEAAGDERVREMALARLLRLDSLDGRDVICRVLNSYRARFSRCPSRWYEVAAALRSAGLRTDSGGAPLDPTGTPYALDRSACDATLGEGSGILRN